MQQYNGNTDKKQLTLPILALVLQIVPVLFSGLLSRTAPGSLAIVMLPIFGFSMALCAVFKGKEVLGTAAMRLAIIAVAMPLLFVGFIVLLFVGAATGIISLM